VASTQEAFRPSEELTAAADDPHHVDQVGASIAILPLRRGWRSCEAVAEAILYFQGKRITMTAIAKWIRAKKLSGPFEVEGWGSYRIKIGKYGKEVRIWHAADGGPDGDVAGHGISAYEGLGNLVSSHWNMFMSVSFSAEAGVSALPVGFEPVYICSLGVCQATKSFPPKIRGAALSPLGLFIGSKSFTFPTPMSTNSPGNIAVESQSPEDVNVGAQLSVRGFAAIVEKIQEAQQGKLKHDYADGGFPIEVTKKKKRSRGKTASDPEAVDASSEPAKPPAAKRKSEGGYAERMEQAVVKSLEGYSQVMEVDSGYDEGGGRRWKNECDRSQSRRFRAMHRENC